MDAERNPNEVPVIQPSSRLLPTVGIIILILAAVVCIVLLGRPDAPVEERVTLEAGRTVVPELFLKDPDKYKSDAVFTGGIDGLDCEVPGEYPLVLTVKGKDYETLVEILDRTAPTATAVSCSTAPGVLPEAETLVTKIKDVSPVTVSYAAQPDVSTEGTVEAQILLTDAYGNSSTVLVSILVTSDRTPPVIDGARDRTYYLGKTVDLKEGITVTDDETDEPTLEIDNSQVDLSTAGTYPVTYTARDEAGNEASVTVQITLSEPVTEQVSEAVLMEMARDVLDDITTDVMSPMEIAFAIFRWTAIHIDYTDEATRLTWQQAAYDVFNRRVSNPFGYYAVSKALYQAAGIENMDVVGTGNAPHYWSLINLGDGWYHVDCTPRQNSGFFFMNTDAELEEYSSKNGNSHLYDKDAYPERAVKSVQSLIDYNTGKVYG